MSLKGSGPIGYAYRDIRLVVVDNRHVHTECLAVKGGVILTSQRDFNIHNGKPGNTLLAKFKQTRTGERTHP